jgi:regulator of cell morphogenesis and NO signaling
MSEIMLSTTIGHLVAENPNRARVFERYGIDYCCGGKRSLGDVCASKTVDAAAIIRELQESEDAAAPGADWMNVSLVDLTHHIEAAHHAYLKEELPRLSGLVQKVARVHGDNHPEMVEVATIFESFRADMEMHMRKEEMILFPMIRQLETTGIRGESHCGSINNPIHVMEAEHDAAGRALEQFRTLTHDFTPPADGCNTFRVTLDGLQRLEADTHEHVHKENNILFPRAAAMERAL